MTMPGLNEGFVGDGEEPQGPLMGEDIGRLGGVFCITDACRRTSAKTASSTRRWRSRHRPTAVGLRSALPPVCEIQFDGFVYPAFDQSRSQVAKRAQTFDGGVQHGDGHSHSLPGWYRRHRTPLGESRALLRQTAGLRVVSCRRRMIAYWMINSRSSATDPISLGTQESVLGKSEVDLETPPAGLFDCGRASRRTDVTPSATARNEDRASCGRDGGGEGSRSK